MLSSVASRCHPRSFLEPLLLCSRRSIWSGPRRGGVCTLLETEAEAGAVDGRAELLTTEDAAAANLPAAVQADLKRKHSVTIFNGEQRTVYVGVGAADNADATAYRKAAVRAIAKLSAARCDKIQIHAPAACNATAAAVAHSSLLANYRFDRYLTRESVAELAEEEEEEHGEEEAADGTSASSASAEAATLPGPHTISSLGVSSSAGAFHCPELVALCNATLFARDLMNEQGDEANPEALEAAASEVAAAHGMKMDVIRGTAELEAAGLRMHAAVGQASRFAPRLVTLEHRGAPESEETVLLVGKGITFDTGGLNLKPTGFMETMHYDMGGAAAVLGAMQALGQLGVRANVVATLGLAENAIGSRAYKPHAILRSHKGLTVEVGNTDAEGRLVLADALSYAQDKYAPSTVIDVATLTGACVVALGPYAAGLFSNNDDLATELVTAGTCQDELLWRLPVLPEHTQELKAARADCSSTGASRYGGACTAAAFLQKFVAKDTTWAHLDIAGPGDAGKARGHYTEGGTGFGAQSLARFVLSRASSS